MTLNVASAVVLALCLTVTSSQQNDSAVSFTTETKSVATFETNEHHLVTLYNNLEEAVAAETGVKDMVKVTDEAVSVTAADLKTGDEVVHENRWGIQLTEEEIELLAKIVWVEARGESETGQKAVVEVVLNRMVSEDFPDNLYDVLSQKNPTQFASWKLRETARPTEKEYTSIYEVLEGMTNILREDTVYFATKKLTGNLDLKIGGHYFCY